MTPRMQRWAEERLRIATVAQDEDASGVATLRWVDKGSMVQEVHWDLLDYKPGALDRWRVLQVDHESRTSFMARDGWLQRPVIVLWRLSLAAHWLGMGAKEAWRALRGREEP